MADGRYAEIYGSFASAYGRLYVTAESGIYCIGDPDAPFEPTARRRTGRSREETAPDGVVASIQVVPAEVIAAAGQPVRFSVLAFDANGRALGPQDADLDAGRARPASRLRVNGEFTSPPLTRPTRRAA